MSDGAPVEVTSRRASITVAAEVTERVVPGQVFMAFHFPEALANALTSQAADVVTSCPEYKVTAVKLAARERAGNGRARQAASLSAGTRPGPTGSQAGTSRRQSVAAAVAERHRGRPVHRRCPTVPAPRGAPR